MQEIIGRSTTLIFIRLVVGHGNAHFLGHVPLTFALKSLNHSFDVVARAQHIVDDQKLVFSIKVFKKILQAVNPDAFGIVDQFPVTGLPTIGGADGDMVGFDAEVL